MTNIIIHLSYKTVLRVRKQQWQCIHENRNITRESLWNVKINSADMEGIKIIVPRNRRRNIVFERFFKILSHHTRRAHPKRIGHWNEVPEGYSQNVRMRSSRRYCLQKKMNRNCLGTSRRIFTTFYTKAGDQKHLSRGWGGEGGLKKFATLQLATQQFFKVEEQLPMLRVFCPTHSFSLMFEPLKYNSHLE